MPERSAPNIADYIAERPVALAERRESPRSREPFVKGPIPLWWLTSAARLPGKALAVGVALWYRAGLKKSRTVRGSWRLWDSFGVGRTAVYRSLRQLEDAGLIRVERQNGKNPVITINLSRPGE